MKVNALGSTTLTVTHLWIEGDPDGRDPDSICVSIPECSINSRHHSGNRNPCRCDLEDDQKGEEMKKIALKACPFCGCDDLEVIAIPDAETRRDDYLIECQNCHLGAMKVVWRGEKFATLKELAALWNRRVEA